MEASRPSVILSSEEDLLGVDDTDINPALVLGDDCALLDEDAILGGDDLLSPVTEQPSSTIAAGNGGESSGGGVRRLASLDASFHNELDYDEERTGELTAEEGAFGRAGNEADEEEDGQDADDGDEKRTRETRFTSERAAAPPSDQISQTAPKRPIGGAGSGYFPRHPRPGNRYSPAAYVYRGPAGRAGFATVGTAATTASAAKSIHINPNFKGAMPADIMASLQHGMYVDPQPIYPTTLNSYPYLAGFSGAVYIRPNLPVAPFNVSVPPPGVVMGAATAAVPAPSQTQTPQIPSIDWTSMVDAFVNRTSRREPCVSPRRRHSSPSTSSSSSRSSSSTRSSSSRSVKGACRGSPKRSHRRRQGGEASRRWSVSPLRNTQRRQRPQDSSKRDDASGNRRKREHAGEALAPRKGEPPATRAGGKKSLDRESREQMAECAQAIGLDDDYLKKLEEQRKQREELARRRRERRQKTEQDEPSEQGQPPSTAPPAKVARRERPAVAAPSTPPASSKAQNTSAVDVVKAPAAAASPGKLKPYLAVLVKNLPLGTTTMSGGALLDRVKKMAQGVGSVKKVWQSSETRISVIFEHHEHAKRFMLQYNGKPINDHKLDIALEKIFVNLAAVP